MDSGGSVGWQWRSSVPRRTKVPVTIPRTVCFGTTALLLVISSVSFAAQVADLQQFFRGDRSTYSSEANPKAKGLKITFDYPSSWRGLEGKRPNTLYQVTSENGRGLELCNLLIKTVPLPDNYRPTKEEILELFSPASIRDFVPEGAVFASSDRTTIEGLPGAWIVYEYDLDRAGIKVKMKAIVHIVYFEAKLIQLGCMVGDRPETLQSKREQHFTSYRPLFQKIANSIVVHNLWLK